MDSCPSIEREYTVPLAKGFREESVAMLEDAGWLVDEVPSVCDGVPDDLCAILGRQGNLSLRLQVIDVNEESLTIGLIVGEAQGS
jgi:hypothetical protein